MNPSSSGGNDVLAVWESLAALESLPLLQALAGISDTPAAAIIEKLRKQFSPAQVNAALELSLARTRAREKFSLKAEQLWCDRAGVEMASSPATAFIKAARFSAAGARDIDDLCSGIGGDLMELARVATVQGVDTDPLRAWMATRNSGCRVRVADATLTPCTAPFAHADPARRASGGKRIFRADDLQPTLAALQQAMRHCLGYAVKLGPGMDLLPEEVKADDEMEFISERGRLVQQVLWSGVLSKSLATRTATRACEQLSISGMPDDPPAASGVMSETLFVPDPALERARLLWMFAEQLNAADAAPGLGILTSADTSPMPSACAPWFEQYQVVEELPPREATVAAWLAARGAGVVTVRTRGGACDPDAWQRALRGTGNEPWTVFVLRLGVKRAVYAVRRVSPVER